MAGAQPSQLLNVPILGTRIDLWSVCTVPAWGIHKPHAGTRLDGTGMGRGGKMMIRGSPSSVSSLVGWDAQEGRRVRASCCLPGGRRGGGGQHTHQESSTAMRQSRGEPQEVSMARG